jgi:hypothetical protein
MENEYILNDIAAHFYIDDKNMDKKNTTIAYHIIRLALEENVEKIINDKKINIGIGFITNFIKSIGNTIPIEIAFAWLPKVETEEQEVEDIFDTALEIHRAIFVTNTPFVFVIDKNLCNVVGYYDKNDPIESLINDPKTYPEKLLKNAFRINTYDRVLSSCLEFGIIYNIENKTLFITEVFIRKNDNFELFDIIKKNDKRAQKQ